MPSHQKLCWNLTGFVRDGCHRNQYNDDNFIFDDEDPIDDDYDSDVLFKKKWSKNPELWDDINYEIIEGLGDSFIGENDLTDIEEGTINITREEDFMEHYCPRNRDKRAYVARPVFWRNPTNLRDRRWFCQRCFKETFEDRVDFPSKWKMNDIRDIRNLGKLQTRYSQLVDHKIGIHYNERDDFRLDEIIRKYIRERKDRFKFDKPQRSLFHYENVKENSYLKTAISTALLL